MMHVGVLLVIVSGAVAIIRWSMSVTVVLQLFWALYVVTLCVCMCTLQVVIVLLMLVVVQLVIGSV